MEPGTILKSYGKNISIEKYYDFKPINIGGMSRAESIQSVKDIFKEAVQIRINENDQNIFLDLSGGWDTRFILANLKSLNKKVIAYTNKKNAEDLEIAKKITKKMNVKHVVDCFPTKVSSDPRLFLDTLYARRQELEFYFRQKDSIHDDFKQLVDCNFFTTSRFTGLFGGELLGNIPFWFEERIKLNFVVSGYKILTREFFKKVLENKPYDELLNCFDKSANLSYLFLTQMGRAYLNIHYLSGWERPTTNFVHEVLLPFTDSKFISLLCGLEYDNYLRGYKLYEILYKKYYPAYMDFPWTFTPMRKRNDLNIPHLNNFNSGHKKNEIYRDSSFVLFLKQRIFIKDDKLAVKRLKELYFLFNWLNIYKSVLDPSDVQFCITSVR